MLITYVQFCIVSIENMFKKYQNYLSNSEVNGL